jgi:hypothetical protein
MNLDPGIAGFLAMLVGLAGFAAWRAGSGRHAMRCIRARGYVETPELPSELVALLARRFGGESRRFWRRDERHWAVELLPRAEEEESTLRFVVTAPLKIPYDGCLLLRAWQGVDPKRLPGRLGVGLLEFGDERLTGLRRLPDPHRRLGGDGTGYLAYAEAETGLEALLPEAFLDRLPALAQTVWALVISGSDLLLLVPFDKAEAAFVAAPDLAARLGARDSV